MASTSIPTAACTSARFARGLGAVALGLAAAACGGGADDPGTAAPLSSAEASAAGTALHPAPSLATRAAAPMSVMFEGCVLDRHYVPTTGAPVRALAADGRLLGHALSDGRGRFTLKLPARSEVLLQVDRPQGESLALRVEAAGSTSRICLLDDQT